MRIIGKILAWIGGFVVVFTLAIVAMVVYFAKKTPKIEKGTIIELVIDKDFSEQASMGFLGSGKSKSIFETVSTIHLASLDPNVSGLVAHIRFHGMKFAHAQELRMAIEDFRKSGKKTVAYAESFGEFGPANTSYYLAAGFDKIWISKAGAVGLTGFAIDSPFVKKLLVEKLGIKPEFFARKEYKNAVNMFTQTKFTPEHKEATVGILQSWFDQLVSGVKEARKLSKEEVVSAIDEAPLSANRALELHLVDGLYDRKEAYTEAAKYMGSDESKRLYLDKYKESTQVNNQEPEALQIALIYGVGEVTAGQSKRDPFSTDSSLGAATVSAAFRKAADDPKIKGVVFRVSSPGGSYIASDIVWQSIRHYKKTGKPLIVSMGDMAASGGYFVAMQADSIVALPSTLTGSIGVFAGKVDARGFMEDKLGVTLDGVSFGKNANMWSMVHPYSKDESDKINKWLDAVYQDFTTKAALGRKMPLEKMQLLAKGRVWTGLDAKNNGLVDEIGGLFDAIQLLKKTLKITGVAKLVVLPEAPDSFEAIIRAFVDPSKNSDYDTGVNLQSDGLSDVSALLHWFRAMGVSQLLNKQTEQTLKADESSQLTSQAN